ncbi:MAG: hypothetical protein NC314_07935 [Roseburia sp.]|nr:hypothetical protein [Roseburia sp.]MCM1242756.1 hypothetical protein [Roseburia sp.]
MKVLLIGKEEDLDLVYSAVRNEQVVDKIICWDDEHGPEELEQSMLLQYDAVVVAIRDAKYAGYLYELIVCILNDDDSRVINFYAIYRAMVPDMIADRVMKNPLRQSYEGMILGISHANYGIIPRCLKVPFCNLAVPSQDLYYNLKTFAYCMSHYRSKISGLKYMVLDLFDYTYFNYDVSLSKTAVSYYYYYGGYTLDAHNFAKNKNFDYSFEHMQILQQEKKLEGISREKMALWETIFDNVHEKTNYREFDNPVNLFERARIVKTKDLEEYQVYTSIVRNTYQETIQENIECFYKLLDLIYELNPDMKVFVVLLPRYVKAEEKAVEAYAGWKKIFYEIIEESGKHYPFQFMDFKEHEISRERACYYDVSHLNYYGAMKFTRMLNEYMELKTGEDGK